MQRNYEKNWCYPNLQNASAKTSMPCVIIKRRNYIENINIYVYIFMYVSVYTGPFDRLVQIKWRT